MALLVLLILMLLIPSFVAALLSLLLKIIWGIFQLAVSCWEVLLFLVLLILAMAVFC